MNLLETKIVCMLLLTVVSLLIGLLPLKLK